MCCFALAFKSIERRCTMSAPGSFHCDFREGLRQELRFQLVYWIGLVSLAVVILALLIAM